MEEEEDTAIISLLHDRRWRRGGTEVERRSLLLTSGLEEARAYAKRGVDVSTTLTDPTITGAKLN